MLEIPTSYGEARHLSAVGHPIFYACFCIVLCLIDTGGYSFPGLSSSLDLYLVEVKYPPSRFFFSSRRGADHKNVLFLSPP